MKKLLIPLLLASATAFGFTDVEKQQAFLQNILNNPGFENGKSSWTLSGGTLSLTSGTGTSLYGRASAIWTPSAGSQSLRSSLYTLSQGLYGKQCLGEVAYKGGASNITLEVLTSANSVLGAVSLIASTNGTVAQAPFVCPTNGSFKIGMRTNSATTTSVILDNFYLGENRSYSQSVLPNNLAYTTLGQGNLRVEAFSTTTVCAPGTCAYDTKTPGILSVTQNGAADAGTYGIAFASGTWAAIPACTGTAVFTGGSPYIWTVNWTGASTTVINFNTKTDAGVADDMAFAFVCVGLKGANP